MEYTTLGDTGMTVSKIAVGCGRFGRNDESKLADEAAQAFVDRAIDLGVNFFDTANVYADGDSEEILGSALEGYDRDWPVVATKGFFDMDEDNPNAQGLSRKAIEQELAASLDRLGMETVDLYQTHRWDYDTPIDETLRALDDAVRRGQTRYIGASSMYAHQFADALHTSDRLDLERFVTMQNHYNLVYREEEREMLPYCDKQGVGVLPWSPLARGFLARPHSELEATPRGEQFSGSDRLDVYRSNGGDEINERVAELAATYGVSMAQLSLAWVLHQDAVDVPIVGMSSIEQLEEAVEAVELSLSSSDVAYLEEPYEPKPVTGHQ
jgi:aryl-alcohol dehydrogenase-like predicted oxidoreductase